MRGELRKRTVCASNLKGQGTSFAIYAAQWNDFLPTGPDYDGGFWFHDEATQFGDTLLGLQTANGMSA